MQNELNNHVKILLISTNTEQIQIFFHNKNSVKY